jgi:hypothetical protein
MNRISPPAGILLCLLAGIASAQQEPVPATGASAQATGQGQASTTSGGEGAAGATGAAAADAQAGEASASLAQGTEVSATLSKPVDAGKAKPGDPVEARASKDVRSGGEVVVPRGSKLMGRVTESRPRGNASAEGESASRLGIVFDRAVLKDGNSVALNGAVTSLGAAQAAGSRGSAGAGGSVAGSSAGAAGGLAGTVGGTVGGVAGVTTGATGTVGAAAGGTASAAARSAGSVGGFDAAGSLRSGSRGVFGLRGLEIAGGGSGAAAGSVISSSERTVHLESGTQMLIVAGARAAGESARSSDSAPAKREAIEDRR